MKLLVTVGSGRFDQLIEAVDTQFCAAQYDIVCQVAKGGYRAKHHHSFEFSQSFAEYWREADIVITHAGAATVFELLEAGKKLVVVPNRFRIDDHQQDMANYLVQQQLAIVCHELDDLSDCVARCARQTFKPYVKDPFFMAQSVLNYFEIPLS